MTVCIAALYDDGRGAVLASDRMVTAHIPIGYEYEHDKNSKIIEVAGATYALLSGDVLSGHEVLRMAQVRLSGQNEVPASIVAETIRGCYQQLRRTRIVHNELEPRGLDLESYYQMQNQLNPTVSQVVDQALVGYNLQVEMLVVGPNGGRFSIYTIVNPGMIIENDAIGHTAIGSGAPHALSSLIEQTYDPSMTSEQVIEFVTNAKQRSEVAPGVGKLTDIRPTKPM